MKRVILIGVAYAGLAASRPATACGLVDAGIPVGTVVQELTIRGHDRPTMGFGSNEAAVVRSSVVARPCFGSLSPTHPPGFRYRPAPAFTGVDTYAVKGCLSDGICTITGAVITVTR